MIVEPTTLLAFVPAALALNLTPGADMMFCLAQGMRGGPRIAVAASAGVSAGSMVHVTLAGIGLGALFAALPGLFEVIRWLGIAYLLYLAWKTLRTPLDTSVPPVSTRRAFRDGFVVNITNPKVILFVLAFIPQFIDPAHGAVLPQFLVFGAIIATGGLVVNAAVGWSAGGIGRALARDARVGLWLRRLSATLFGALALKLATDGRT